MNEAVVVTFTAAIYVGLKLRHSGEIIDRAVAVEAIQKYVDRVGLCVSITDLQFVYSNGSEPGLAVGLINYPRFPSSAEKIRAHALDLGEILLTTCQQIRVSIVFSSETVMLTNELLADEAKEAKR